MNEDSIGMKVEDEVDVVRRVFVLLIPFRLLHTLPSLFTFSLIKNRDITR